MASWARHTHTYTYIYRERERERDCMENCLPSQLIELAVHFEVLMEVFAY